ncbi:MAG TPA: pyridoxamine 5'-phosphate oxidase family protein [Thermoleophilaceae bacterium]|jgi:PPOX class probable F420-dependent enzyme|nr:pyridoxamine 5'-phosphate oxidase family protein [Thermoleophilaceae bacterium]
MSLDALPGWARPLLDAERVARLAFVDDEERPRVLPVTFAVSGDALWSAIDDKPKRVAEPARVRWLRRRPAAALLVDVYDDDWTRLAWVQLLGRVEVIGIGDGPEEGAASDASDALAALAAKYEPYAERTPPGPLLRLTVERTLHWRAAG